MDQDVIAMFYAYDRLLPAACEDEFGKFHLTCYNYFNRGRAFNQLLNDALFGQMFDILLDTLQVEYHEKLPALERARPSCYENVEEVFKGEDGEDYPFNEMFETNEFEFNRGWYVEGGGGAAGPQAGVGVWKNTYIEKWTPLILASMRDEEARLNEIKNYALKAYECWSDPLLNCDLGVRRLIYGNRCFQLMLTVFTRFNWAWVYDSFEMKVYEPAMIEEWRENEVHNRA